MQGLGLATSSLQLLMAGTAPPIVLNPKASPPRRPKSSCHVGFSLKKEPDLFWWKSEQLLGSTLS